MAIPLRGDLVRQIIRRRYGSILDLVVAWEERVASGVQKDGRARDRATIYRWLANGLPANRADIFGFAGLLDIDPIALLDIDEQFIQRNFGRERRLFQMGHAARTPLSTFWSLYLPSPGWPNAEIAHTFFDRPWVTKMFVHDPAEITNVYAAVYLCSQTDEVIEAPRTYHFAYRRTGARDRLWRPYGTVIGDRDGILLLSENGDYQRVPDERSPSAVVAETYFGPGPAEFLVASLHGFEARVSAPTKEAMAVRFLA